MTAVPEPGQSGLLYVSRVPLELRRGDGLSIVVTDQASAPVPIPGAPGDILAVRVSGPADVWFRVGEANEYATLASNKADEDLWLIPNRPHFTHISLICNSGDQALVTINCYGRGE